MMNYPTLSAFRWVPKVYQERCEARPAFRKALADHLKPFETNAA